MFENIIGHEGVIEALRAALQTRTMPHGILLAGPRYEAKCSVALEIARALTCHEDARWSCPCAACRLHRSLSHQDLLVLGPRYFQREIAAAAETLHRERQPATVYLFVRALRKLTRRFDEQLWPAGRPNKAVTPLAQLEELLQRYEPPELPPDDDEVAAAWVADCRAVAGKLVTALPYDAVPVDMVRAVAAWTRLTTGSASKVVIIEEAHTLNEAARNALLKVLEEPPRNVYFILTSSRRTAVIPTVLSRVRSFALAQRAESVHAEVLKRVFRYDVGEDRASLSVYFRGTAAEGAHLAHDLARRTVAALLDGAAPAEVWAAAEVLSDRGLVELWLDSLTEQLRERIPHTRVEHLPKLEYAAREIASMASRVELRNMNPVAAVKSLLVDGTTKG